MKSSALTRSCMRTTKAKEREIPRSGADRLAYQIQMLLVVNAPKAFQRKLVEGADKSTTHQAKIDPVWLDSLPLPSPAEQTQRAEAGYSGLINHLRA